MVSGLACILQRSWGLEYGDLMGEAIEGRLGRCWTISGSGGWCGLWSSRGPSLELGQDVVRRGGEERSRVGGH